MSEFDALLAQHRPWAVRFAERLCQDRDVAEDIVQDASIRAWQHFASYKTSLPFQNWFARIIRNEANRPSANWPEGISLDALLELGIDFPDVSNGT